MPRKEQGWITFQSSEEERQILEEYCQQSQRTKTEILRELVRSLNESSTPPQKSRTRRRQQKDSSEHHKEPISPSSDYKAMKVSARNVFKGTIKRMVTGAVNTEVKLEIAPGVELTAIITSTSADELGLAEGKQAYAVIKSSNVMIAME
ncbi:MAG TPA: molybdopterin-binding protein [Coleofasciculaceae cyanobacterium]